MRLTILRITSFVLFLFALNQHGALAACCEGMCGVTQQCDFYNYFQNSNWYPECDPGFQIQLFCTEDTDGQDTYWDPNNPHNPNWTPHGSSGTQCTYSCEVGGSSSSGGYVLERKDIYCGDCAPTPGGGGTPTPGGGGTGTPTPTPTTSPLVQGSIHTDTGAALSGAYCAGPSSPLTVSGWSLAATKNGNTYNASFSYANPHTFSINTTTTGTGHTVTLDLSGQVGTDFVCSCPAPYDPNNPYICRYTGVTSPTANVNFYLQEYDLSNTSWFQIFGGNLFATGPIATDIPDDFCSADGNCVSAFLAPLAGSSNLLSSGFPISTTGSQNNLQSSEVAENYHSYFHLSTRPSNLNAYGMNTSLSELSYDYFHGLASDAIQAVGDGSDLEPLFSDFTNAVWWQADDINYVRILGNVSIDETQGFQITSGQQLVVFVQGNLTLDDSNPGDTNRKVTSVAEGGFLSFIVSGNITVTPNVGYNLNPLAPSVPVVSTANSNLEGVFLADGALTIQTKTAIGDSLPDRKFIGSGTFIGWEGVNLNRSFDDNNFGPILNNNQAIENFVYRPDLLVNWPTKLKTSLSNWREVDPQLISD